MGEQIVGDVFPFSSQRADGFFEIDRVLQNDGGNHQVETTCAMALIFVGAVADFAESMETDGPGQGVVCLAFVEAGGDASTQSRVL